MCLRCLRSARASKASLLQHMRRHPITLHRMTVNEAEEDGCNRRQNCWFLSLCVRCFSRLSQRAVTHSARGGREASLFGPLRSLPRGERSRSQEGSSGSARRVCPHDAAERRTGFRPGSPKGSVVGQGNDAVVRWALHKRSDGCFIGVSAHRLALVLQHHS